MPPHPAHAPALGAAALGAAAAATGKLTAAVAGETAAKGDLDLDLDLDLAPPEPQRRYAPRPELRSLYDQAYECFCQVHPSLQGLFQQLRDPPSRA